MGRRGEAGRYELTSARENSQRLALPQLPTPKFIRANLWELGKRQSLGIGSYRSERRAQFSEESSPAAVLHILELNRQTVGVGEIELGRSAFGAAAVRHAE